MDYIHEYRQTDLLCTCLVCKLCLNKDFIKILEIILYIQVFNLYFYGLYGYVFEFKRLFAVNENHF